jgi:tRNA(Leu) C34 or U34 (ribose-2'-O)-methylase TrmL
VKPYYQDRGYWGIGIVNGKFSVNAGQLLRSGLCFGANFLFTVGCRFSKQPTDTTNAEKHIPLFEFSDIEDMLKHRPNGCVPICIEIKPWAIGLQNFSHPERAMYILGQEDGDLPDELCILFSTIKIPTAYCLNVAIAGSIVMYDRIMKRCSQEVMEL